MTATARPIRTREVVAWSLYDTANSAFFLVVVTAMFPFFFRDVVLGIDGSVASDVARGDLWWGRMLSLSALLTAVTAPVMGALAEARRWRKPLLFAYTAVAVAGTALLGFVGAMPPLVAAGVFVLANAATEGGMVFYGSLLPSVARPEQMGRVSGNGWAAGYIGSIVALLIAALVIGDPQPATFILVALWFAAFAAPLFLIVEDRTPPVAVRGSVFAGLRDTVRSAMRYRDLRRFLLAYFLYNDAVTTTIGFAALFAKDELGFAQPLLIGMILGVQVTGAVGAVLLGRTSDRIGNVQAILRTLILWIVICIAAFVLALDLPAWASAQAPRQYAFLAVGLLVGFAMGAVQSQSRSLLARMVPEHRTAEFFGVYAVCGRFSAVLGPALFGWLSYVTGSKSWSILSLVLMFAAGAWLLRGVDEQRGRAELLAGESAR